jgi:hypothetical protein
MCIFSVQEDSINYLTFMVDQRKVEDVKKFVNTCNDNDCIHIVLYPCDKAAQSALQCIVYYLLSRLETFYNSLIDMHIVRMEDPIKS